MATRQLDAKLIICSVPTRDFRASREFYNALLGGRDFARNLTQATESYYRPISEDGLTLCVATRQDEAEPITCWFAVDDLDATISKLEQVGGKLVRKSNLAIAGQEETVGRFKDDLKGRGDVVSDSAGEWAQLKDPDGNYVGLMQLESFMQGYFKSRKEDRTLSREQVIAQAGWELEP